jgi:hypothetical protein
MEVLRRKKGKQRRKWILSVGYQYFKKAMVHVDVFGARLVRIGPTQKNYSWQWCAFFFMLQASINNLCKLNNELHLWLWL